MAHLFNALIGQSGFFAKSANLGGSDYRPHPERDAQWHFTARFHSPLSSPGHCQVRASRVVGSASLHLRLSTVAVADTKIADSNSIPLSATPRSSARPLHYICVSKLFDLNSTRLIPTPTAVP